MLLLINFIFIVIAHPISDPFEQPMKPLNEKDQSIVNELRELANKLPNVTSDLSWERMHRSRPFSLNVTPRQPPLYRNNSELVNSTSKRQFMRKAPESIVSRPQSMSCGTVFFEYRETINSLQGLVCNQKYRDLNYPEKQKHKEFVNKEYPNLTYLRDFYISEGRTQRIYYNPSRSEIVVGLESMRLISLNDYIAWIKAQADMVHLLLAVEDTLRPFFQIKYHSLTTTTPGTDTFGVEYLAPITG